MFFTHQILFHNLKRYIVFPINCVYLVICLTLLGCLPIEVNQPECFPQEGCPTNLECVNGQCLEPPIKQSKVTVNCLRYFGCYQQLVSAGFEHACLIIEQPAALYGLPFNFNQAREADGLTLGLKLQSAPLRASIILMDSESTEACPQSPADIERKQVHQQCDLNLGCILRLRTQMISAEQIESQEQIELKFDGEDGQCVESIWGMNMLRVEQCGGEDLDCDGFVDEGLQCEGEDLR